MPEPNVTGTDSSASAPSEPENYADLALTTPIRAYLRRSCRTLRSLVKFWPSTPLAIQPAVLRMKVPDIS